MVGIRYVILCFMIPFRFNGSFDWCIYDIFNMFDAKGLNFITQLFSFHFNTI